MAMLAEPRRKQRWTLNPRGKHWSEDSTKFGQKMLEKMGWSSGKGLGANEQGMTEHVRVAFKNDSAGIGFKNDGMDKAWTEHQDGFNDFLKELQGSKETGEVPIVETKHETFSGKSLELKSKQSRARVHYHKFTRGKDVNKYSSKDLANIFGHKDLSTINAPKEEKIVEEEEFCPDPLGTRDTLGGVLTIKSGSITDYLKNKRPNVYNIAESNEGDNRADSEDEPMYAGFGFSSNENKEESSNNGTVGICKYGGFVNPCLDLNSPEPTASPTVKSKKSKKRKSGNTFNDEEMNDSVNKAKEDPSLSGECMNGFTNPGLTLGNETEEAPNGSEFEVSRAEFGVTNSAFDLEGEKERKKRVTFNDQVEYSTDPIKKKKGKATLDKFEVEIKKPKRKRKHEESLTEPTPIAFVNEALDCDDKSEEMQDNEINEHKTRKAKKRRPTILETIVEIPEEDKSETVKLNALTDADISEIQENDVTETEGKKKKKKKKKDKIKDQDIQKEEDTKDVQLVEQVSKKKKKDQSVQEQISENGTDESKKKKKRKHAEKADTNEPEVTPEPSNTKDEETSTRKKKDKKSKRDAEKYKVIPIVNNSENEKEISGKENECTEDGAIKSKKKKSKKEKTKSAEKLTEVNITGNVNERNEEAEDNVQAKINSDGTNMEFRIPRSPWNERARMSKKLLQSFFHRNAISNFPGSNIYDIEGYGAQMS